jgi:hypothetical protein
VINTFKINPYNIFEIRRCSFPPDHFDYTTINVSYNLKDAIEKWIEKNCKSRYYIGKSVACSGQDNKIVNTFKVGFEESKELSYFMLACPYLKYR